MIEGLSTKKRKGSFVAIGGVDEQRLGYQSDGEDERPLELEGATGLKSC